MTIKAIETHYKGYRFRSRLEARWAVFLDNLGVKYRYEHQGYTLDGTPYLPDFFLPFDPAKVWKDGDPQEAGYWLEIKPLPPSEEEERLLSLLAIHTGHVVYCFAGDPWPGEFMILWHRRHIATDGANEGKVTLSQKSYHPQECYFCDGSGLDNHPETIDRVWKGHVFTRETRRECDFCGGGLIKDNLDKLTMNMAMRFHGFLWNVGYSTRNADTQQALLAAFHAARSARFEHGETPR